jgi:hypothetical protein
VVHNPDESDNRRDENQNHDRRENVVEKEVHEWPHILDQFANAAHVVSCTVNPGVGSNAHNKLPFQHRQVMLT